MLEHSQNNQAIPMFVINLKKEATRRAHMQTQAEALGLELIFIDAVYGKDLPQKDFDNICNHEKSQNILNRRLLRGEVGVALSQMSVYQKMLDENIQEAIIFEDDVNIDSSIIEVMQSTTKFPSDWELVLLGYYKHSTSNKLQYISRRKNQRISKNFKIVRFTTQMDGAHGYMINLRGAKRLLKTLKKGIVEPLDHYTGGEKHINVYGISPQCVTVDADLLNLSSIDKERKNTKNNSNLALSSTLKQKVYRYRKNYQRKLLHFIMSLKTPKQYR